MQRTKKKHTALIIVVCLLFIAAIAVCIFSHFGGFGTGEIADTEEFAKYSASVLEIAIPEGTQIVALGEATHGNSEFQQLKLNVFRTMVEKYGVRAFALEGDFGGCEVVNRYIHGGEGTAREAAAAIGFAIYRTQETEDLISWMRSYNETAPKGGDLRFYGFDMQRYENNYRYLLEAAQDAGLDTSELEAVWDEDKDSYKQEYTSKELKKIIKGVRKELPAQDAQALHFADIMLQNLEISGEANDNAGYIALRDRLMAENTMWVLDQEKARGNECIFIAGHNGHVEQNGSYDKDNKVMGALLADELGDGYFAIGTDFYKTSCNLPKMGGSRKTHTFYSHDPLAKASKECGLMISYLDFANIPDVSPLKAQTEDYTWMGSLGEGYNFLMALIPRTYRVWRSPAETYDAMIFVTDAHPTEIKPIAE